MRRLLLTISLLLVSSARAEPPLATDDASVLDAGKCQVEAFLRRQRGGAEREARAEFACNFTGSLELMLGREWTRTGLDTGRATLVEAKLRLREGYAVAIGATHAAAAEPYLNLIASVPLVQDSTLLHANLGARRDRAERVTRGTWGVALEHALVQKLQLLGEVAGERGAKPLAQAGVRVLVTPDFNLSAALGRQRGSRALATVGMHFEF